MRGIQLLTVVSGLRRGLASANCNWSGQTQSGSQASSNVCYFVRVGPAAAIFALEKHVLNTIHSCCVLHT